MRPRHLNSVVAWCRIISVVEFLSVLQGYLRGSPEMIKHLNPCNNSAPAAFGCPYEEWKPQCLFCCYPCAYPFGCPYEEWKLYGVLNISPSDILSDVPMRNGNYKRTSPSPRYPRAFGCPYEEWKRHLEHARDLLSLGFRMSL